MTGAFSQYDLTPNAIEEARRKKAATSSYIDLTSGNPTEQGLLFPPQILAQVAEKYWQIRHYQPDPRGALPARQAIARYYQSRTVGESSALDKSTENFVDIENIFITASTSEAYSLVLALLTQPGDNVLVPEVTYPLFDYLADLYHLELRSYRLDERHDWQIDEDSIRAAADERTRAILFISPHNPTGMIVQKALPALTELGVPLICDEVFTEFVYRAKAAPPLGLLHPELPIFHLNGVSKMFALPDMKLGWIAITGLNLSDYNLRLELLNDTFLSCSSLMQYMLPFLFQHGSDFIEEMQARVHQNITKALEFLNQSRYIEVEPPDGGYYLFAKVRGWDSEEKLVLALLEAGVLVHPGYFYGYEEGVHIVISCLLEPETLLKGLQIVRQVIGVRG